MLYSWGRVLMGFHPEWTKNIWDTDTWSVVVRTVCTIVSIVRTYSRVSYIVRMYVGTSNLVPLEYFTED